MKIDILAMIEKGEVKNNVPVDVYDQASLFTAWTGLEVYVDQSDTMEGIEIIPVMKWMDTDTLIGLDIYTLNGVPFVCTIQQGRKCDADVKILDLKATEAFRTHFMDIYMRSLFPSLETLGVDNQMIQDLHNLDSEYTLGYASQIIEKEGKVNGRVVEILRGLEYNMHDIDDMLHKVWVKFKDTQEMVKVNVDQIVFDTVDILTRQA